MATSKNPQELKGWDKVVAWYASKAYAVNIIYSAGASIVIVGALFKILHWPGASYVLMVGMFTEAFLFILGIFEKPHATYHWEHVFPQLVGDETKELLGGGGGTTLPNPNASQDNASVPTLSEAQLKGLNDGIANLSKTAEQLAQLGKVAEGSQKLSEKMEAASLAAEQFAGSQSQLSAASQKLGNQFTQLDASYAQVNAGVQQVAELTKGYAKNTEALNTQLSSINAVYELQLTNAKAQADAVKAQAAVLQQQTEKLNAANATLDAAAQNLKALQAETLNAVEAGKQYTAAQQKLTAQIADLNKVYGNMLNALA
ncbi:MAG: gliding motility protein GldL [Paludibacteraceae bacterium]|nr:gliding motility protein GldL [Paludibacteraceae bacterium]